MIGNGTARGDEMSRGGLGRRRDVAVVGLAAVLVMAGGAAAWATLTTPLPGQRVSLRDLPEWAPLAPSGDRADDLVLAYTVDTEMADTGPFLSYGVRADGTLVELPADRPPRQPLRPVETSAIAALPQARLTSLSYGEGWELTYRGPDGRQCVAARWAGTSGIYDVVVDERRIGPLLPACSQR